MDLKLAQELSRFNQYPFFILFLDLRKFYETVDHGRLIRTLEGYRAGPQM